MGKLNKRNCNNPFMDLFGQSIQDKFYNESYQPNEAIGNFATGEVYSSSVNIKTSKKADSKHFVKLIITTDSIKKLSCISQASYKLLLWIMDNIEYSEDKIIINSRQTILDLGYKSKSSLTSAIDGLVKTEILARADGGTWIYYINPSVFYKGTMVKRYKDHAAKIAKRTRVHENSNLKPNPEFVFDKLPKEAIDFNSNENIKTDFPESESHALKIEEAIFERKHYNEER